MRFQPRRLKGEKCVGAGVRLIESIAGEFGHQVEDFLGLLLRDLARGASGEEFLALGGHFFGLLLAHGAAQQVGVSEREPREAVGDLHHLFLIQNHAPGFGQYFFERGQIIGDFLFAVLARDEVVDHAALDWAGPVQRVQRGQILQAGGLIAPQNVAHAVRLKLENAGGVALGEKRVRGSVIKCQSREVYIHAAIHLDQPHGIAEHGECGQAQKIHLQQADALERIHVVLRGDFVFVRLVERNDFGERPRRNHHSCRVRRRVPSQSFQPQRHLNHLFDLFVLLAHRIELRRLFQSLVQRDIQLGRHQFG